MLGPSVIVCNVCFSLFGCAISLALLFERLPSFLLTAEELTPANKLLYVLVPAARSRFDVS